MQNNRVVRCIRCVLYSCKGSKSSEREVGCSLFTEL